MTLQRQKEILIAVFVGLYSTLYFLGFKLLLNSATWTTLTVAIMVLGGLIWCALMVSATAFVTNRSGSNIVVAIVPSILLIIFSGFALDAVIGALLVFLVLLVIQRRLNGDLNSRVNVHIVPVFLSSTKQAIFALLIVAITLFLPNLMQSFDNQRLALPSETIAAILKPFESTIRNLIPGYQTNSTVDQIIDNQLASQNIGLPQEIIQTQKPIVRQQFGQQFGQQLSGRETLPDIVAGVINKYMQRLARENKFVAAAVVIAATFLTVKALIPILVWPALLFVKIFMYIAERIGLISLIRTQVTVERLTL